MIIVDANIILRYLLKDNQILYQEALEILEKRELFIPYEIAAEVIYVLEKVYKVNRKEIISALESLFSYNNISFPNKNIILKSLSYYFLNKLDFADSLLCAYKEIENHEIFTFDKQLLKVLNKI